MEYSAQLKELTRETPNAHGEERVGSIASAQQKSVVRMVASRRLRVGDCSHLIQNTVQWYWKMVSGLR